ncbi:MAG: hypothetical protein ACLFWI_23755 [Coleofasciculus sp.]|uniref:hypothetical protein n=1 Tax=Coleofasciculus sp. TaxID=3100458 RepID=UPI003A4B3D48
MTPDITQSAQTVQKHVSTCTPVQSIAIAYHLLYYLEDNYLNLMPSTWTGMEPRRPAQEKTSKPQSRRYTTCLGSSPSRQPKPELIIKKVY